MTQRFFVLLMLLTLHAFVPSFALDESSFTQLCLLQLLQFEPTNAHNFISHNITTH